MSGLTVARYEAGVAPVEQGKKSMVSTAIRVEVLDSFDAARPVFDQLYQSGCATPYQHFDWLERYFRFVDEPVGGQAALIVLRDAHSEPLLLLPMVVSRKGPVRIARFIGGKHSNFNMPLVSREARQLDAFQLREVLRRAGSEAGIDLFALMNQTIEWEGNSNPLAILGGQPSASAGYKLSLRSDGEALLQERLSKDARKKLRQKEQKLSAMGTLSYHKPEGPEAAQQILHAFFDLKAQRFGTQGIEDPFAGADIRAFLDSAVVPDENGTSTVVLHALMLDGRPISIYGGLTGKERFCGLFTAFDSSPEISRNSPGDILLMAMIKDACKRGLSTFDLGVGEARYKTQICDQREDLIDTFIPVSLTGHIAGLALSATQNAKRRIKQSAAGQSLITRFRKLRAKP